MATGLAKRGCPRVVQDRILNHVGGSVSAIYDRHRYDAEARAWLQKWVDFPEALTAKKVVSLRAREAEARLHKALLQTFEGLVAATERRDPCTAGHQRGVADLVVAIGRRMQLPELQIEGLRLGALVHDIGKIAVPADLLTLPRALTPVEQQFMRQHVMVGYDLLKDVELPWSIARAVREHHERLDGSGYPDGLKGDAICLEARIIAVADTVGAMASHRPYRPSLGLPAAMQEIVEGRGSRYDALVVDACAAVVTEGFEFS